MIKISQGPNVRNEFVLFLSVLYELLPSSFSKFASLFWPILEQAAWNYEIMNCFRVHSFAAYYRILDLTFRDDIWRRKACVNCDSQLRK